MSVLNAHYKETGKHVSDEIFQNKIKDISVLPVLNCLKDLCANLLDELKNNLIDLEIIFNETVGKIDVSSKVVN